MAVYIANLFEVTGSDAEFHCRVVPACRVHPNAATATVTKNGATLASVPVPIPILNVIVPHCGTFVVLTGREDGRALSSEETAGRISAPVPTLVAPIPLIEAIAHSGTWEIEYGDDSDDGVDLGPVLARGSSLMSGRVSGHDSASDSDDYEYDNSDTEPESDDE